MKKVTDFFEHGNVAAYTLVGTAFVALLTIIGVTSIPSPYAPEVVTDMYIAPQDTTTVVGEIFTINVIVETSAPVNVFAGELRFDPSAITVESIDYNTSIAELWAEKPWYDNGAGTLNFAGGTTKENGFYGNDLLINVTFRTLKEGTNFISIVEPKIFLHDGLGSEATLKPSIDSIVTITPESVVISGNKTTTNNVLKQRPSTDLNGDGKQTIADISIFIMHIAGDDERYDFNLDGKVGLKDLNILMSK